MTLLPLPLSLTQVNDILTKAFAYFPPKFDSKESRVLLLANGAQESDGFNARRQYNNGPARGIFQFEEGNRKAWSGVWAVLNNEATSAYASAIAQARGYDVTPKAVWAAMETDDVLAAAYARLLLWADRYPLPKLGDVKGAWATYIRAWNPGKPHPAKYPGNYGKALAFIQSWQV